MRIADGSDVACIRERGDKLPSYPPRHWTVGRRVAIYGDGEDLKKQKQCVIHFGKCLWGHWI